MAYDNNWNILCTSAWTLNSRGMNCYLQRSVNFVMCCKEVVLNSFMNSNCATLFRLLLGIKYLMLVEEVKIVIPLEKCSWRLQNQLHKVAGFFRTHICVTFRNTLCQILNFCFDWLFSVPNGQCLCICHDHFLNLVYNFSSFKYQFKIGVCKQQIILS
jgi:hypothetical protein